MTHTYMGPCDHEETTKEVLMGLRTGDVLCDYCRSYRRTGADTWACELDECVRCGICLGCNDDGGFKLNEHGDYLCSGCYDRLMAE